MPERRVSWIPIAAFWSAFALILATQTWLSMITHGHSPLRLLAYQLVVWSFWAAITPALFAFTRRFPPYPFNLRNWIYHSGAMVAIAPVHVAIWVTLTIAIKPYDAMTETRFAPYFPNTIIARFPFEIVLYVAVVATAQILELYSRTSRLERALGDARLHTLELQLQPHFLFNTLNAVSALVRVRKNSEAVEVIAALSDLLRYSLDHAGDQRVPLEQEMAILSRYLEIQSVRFSDRLSVTIAMDEAARCGAVPTLILQPLAENAIRHGIEQVAAAGRIEVKACRREGVLEIEVFNTGTLTAAPRGIGIRNTEERLAQLYGERGTFELRKVDGGVLARISIPWSEVA